MWLDRFSGQSTPTGSNSPSRAYSPAPRRPVRSGLGLTNNRSNVSLDLSNNTSTASFGSAARLPNGSGLCYEQKPPAEVEDPSRVLRGLLGIKDQKHDAGGARDATEVSTGNEALDMDVDVDEDINFGGRSLHEFAHQPAVTRSEAKSGDAEQNDRQKLEAFHLTVRESDEILKAAQSYLTGFKAELGQVSAEIENLQQRSTQLNTQLENRRHVEKILGPAVEGISISPVTVRAIAEGPIDDVFVEALSEVETRSARLEDKENVSEPVKAIEDVKPLLQDLKAKAVERIRDFIVTQIKALRSPNINAQIIQQQKFLSYKDLFLFLARHHPVLAEEIGQAYINTMKWYYSSHFTRYQAALEKIQVYSIDSYDLMGAEMAAIKRSTAAAGRAVAQQQHDAFNLGKRLEILKTKNNTAAIPSYLAEESNKSAHYLEVPFRHFNQALVDNATAEYSVATEIFATLTYQQITRKTVDVLEPTFTLGHNLTKQLIENTTDCFGILICVRLNQRLAFEMQRRKVPVMDNYINYTNILLWPRFQQVMDQHCDSLKKAITAANTNRGAAAAAAAFNLVSGGGGGGGGADASRGAGGGGTSLSSSVAPHPITQRFGQFLHGLLSLSTDASDDEPLGRSLDRLRSEYEGLMTKLSKAVGADASKRARFLHNNYNLVLTIISDATGKLADAQKEHFGNLLAEAKK
ncbi:hypothetical protein DV736_g4477, partial [Chaetothyriales sp. CBS 134916]